ncbi:MAG: hypothetical protein EBX52_04435 [Proteobacteria bacterium]|nr:hypothetical protein [Pseudomonadota bacterium]
MRTTLLVLTTLALGLSQALPAKADSNQPKDWTLLVYLNGNNNLDSFGAMNINQMEKVGSNAKINIIVQWASLETHSVKRLYIKKDNDTGRVTSPVIENMGNVDMGDWHSVVDFVKWGAEKYPANHYFVDIWDHGSGWHAKQGGIGAPSTMDISWDDLTGNHITTKQLAMALDQSAKIIGHKIDLYASDACLMAMAEIAQEVKDSVSVFAGSEETEPGAGWPYDTFLSRWNSLQDTSPQAVAKALSEEYAKSYQSGNDAVTFSAFDLNALPELTRSLRAFSDSLKGIGSANLRKLVDIANRSQNFAVSDYVDLMDFMNNLKSAHLSQVNASLIGAVADAHNKVVITTNNVRFPKAHGMSIWIPTSSWQYSQFADLYSQMSFDQETHWGDLLKGMLK